MVAKKVAAKKAPAKKVAAGKKKAFVPFGKKLSPAEQKKADAKKKAGKKYK